MGKTSSSGILKAGEFEGPHWLSLRRRDNTHRWKDASKLRPILVRQSIIASEVERYLDDCVFKPALEHAGRYEKDSDKKRVKWWDSPVGKGPAVASSTPVRASRGFGGTLGAQTGTPTMTDYLLGETGANPALGESWESIHLSPSGFDFPAAVGTGSSPGAHLEFGCPGGLVSCQGGGEFISPPPQVHLGRVV